jgi:hypothetical protein
MFDKLDLACAARYPSDIAADPFCGGEPPKTRNVISEYRRIQNWENFFIDSAIYSVAQSLGISYEEGFHILSTITGDLFAYLYSHTDPCDSGLTNYFFLPEAVKKAYKFMGYDCVYLSNAQIKHDFRTAMNCIKASVDRGIPVMAWGIGGVIMHDGVRYEPLPEGCLIGGYDGDTLYVNLYPGPERLAKGTVDDLGYTKINGGLSATNGIFIVGEKTDKPDNREFFREIIRGIPALLTLSPAQGYTFGAKAFADWADVMENDSFWNTQALAEKNNWDLHGTAYCSTCTSLPSAVKLLSKIAVSDPEYAMAAALVPLYSKLANYNQEIWDFQDGFMPPAEKLMAHEYRAHIASILREMGGLCDEIVSVFE